MRWRSSSSSSGLTWAVALGSLQGLSGRRASFLRTPKFDEREALRHALRSSRVEALLGAICLAAAAVVLFTRHGTDAVFLAVLCGWSTTVFLSAPVTAWWAVDADLTGTLRRRRELETASSRLLLARRPARLSYAGAAIAAALLLIAPGLAIGPSSGGLAGVLRPAASASDDEPARAAAPRRAVTARATPGAATTDGEDGAPPVTVRAVSRRQPAVSTPGRRRTADRRATPAPGRARQTPDRKTPAPTAAPTPAAMPQSARPTATPTPPPDRPATTPTPPPNRPTATPTPARSRPVATPTPPPNRPTATPTPPPTPRPSATPTPHH